MSQYLYAEEKDSDYENFYATCPYCGFRNIFNRVTDLATTAPISFMAIRCLNDECGQNFNINADTANAAYEMLIYDCHELIKKKKYSYCILNLAQAYEVFFALFLNIKLAFNPFNREMDSISDLDKALSRLYEKTKKCTYYTMRNIFFNLIVNNVAPTTISDALEVINNIPSMRANLPKSEFEKIEDEELKAVLLRIDSCMISKLRNDVVHKMAYRPSLDEVEKALEETKGNIFPVSKMLGVLVDDASWYLNR